MDSQPPVPARPALLAAPALIPTTTSPSNDASLSEGLNVIRKRKLVIILCTLAGLGYGVYKALTQVKMFEASGRIEIRSGSSNQYRVNTGGPLENLDSATRIPNEVAILTSDSLMYGVARQLDLANNRDFTGARAQTTRVSLDNPVVREDTIHRLQSNTHVIPIAKTDIIRITYDSLDSQLAAAIVNAIIEEYRDYTLNSRYEATARVQASLSNRLSGLKAQVEAAQERVLDFQKRLGVLGFDPNHNQITADLEELSRASTTAQLARILAESRYRVLSGADPDSIDSMIDMPGGGSAGVSQTGLTTLRTSLATAQAAYAQMLSPGGLGPNHPQAKALKAQIDALQKAVNQEEARLLAQARQALVAARANEQQTTGALESEKNDAYRLRDDLVQYTIAQREFESARTLYEGLSQRIQTASVQSGLESQEIDIIDPAVAPVRPNLKPRSSFVTLYGFVFLFIGIVLAFVLESLDTALRNVAEIEQVTGLASLALIPRARRPAADAALTPMQRNLAVLANPKSQFSESFRSLRTSLLLSTAGGPPQVILLTSAAPSEGKTTVCTNLSCVLAQRGVRVLLMDADLRRPTVHHRFGLNGRIGLTSVLTGSATLEQAIQNVPDVPNLDILPSGPVPPFPTEMLSSNTMNELIQKFRGTYTHIVIDSPPLLSVTDGVVLATGANAVVLIVRHGKSSKHVVKRARDLLYRAGAPLTGIVLNAVDLKSPEYYGYYGYSGYSYAGVDTSTWEPQDKDAAAARSKNGDAR